MGDVVIYIMIRGDRYLLVHYSVGWCIIPYSTIKLYLLFCTPDLELYYTKISQQPMCSLEESSSSSSNFMVR